MKLNTIKQLKNDDKRYARKDKSMKETTKTTKATKRKRLQRSMGSSSKITVCNAQLMERTTNPTQLKFCKRITTDPNGRCGYHKKLDHAQCAINDSMNPNGMLKVQKSLIPNAGNGVFLKAGNSIQQGDIITKYEGHVVNTIPMNAKYTYKMAKNKFLEGINHPELGKGYGSLVNRANNQHKANCAIVSNKTNDQVLIRATKYIGNYRRDTELYCKYGKGYHI